MNFSKIQCTAVVGLVLAMATTLLGCGQQSDQGKKGDIVVGLVAARSGGSALSGQAIEWGLQAAIDDVNSHGGVLGGRHLRLEIRDDGGNPAQGVAAARDLVEREHAVAIFGGLSSPVSVALVPVIQELKVPYLGVWAAATEITENGQNPNYLFRVSGRDDLVDQFLVGHLVQDDHCHSPGLILENSPWGDSNRTGLITALSQRKMSAAGIEKFNDGDTDMTPQLLRLKNEGADCLVMVANAPEGGEIIRSKTQIGWDVPVISHWGISGGRFPELAGAGASSVRFIQTYSFFKPQNDIGQHLIAYFKKKYGIADPSGILAPVGTADSYDALHLLAIAINQAGTTDGPKVRDALEHINQYNGLIKTYDHPFSAKSHDALSESDYILCAWKDGKILPVSK